MTNTASEPKYTYRLPPCPAYDVEGTERWLGEMAQKGLHLAPDGFFLGLVTFERGEGASVKYRLEAAPAVRGMFDDATSPDTEAVELAEHYGWEYVARRGEFHIYRTVREDARELNTDPRVRALAMKGIRSRQRWEMFEIVFWLILYPLLYRRGTLLFSPVSVVVALGTPLFLFSLVMIVWLCTRAVVRAVRLERLRRRLLRGESLYTADGEARLHRYARRHRVMTVVRVVLVTVWIVILAVWTLHWMSETGEVSLEDYLADGREIPFATVREIAQTQGEIHSYRQRVRGYGNTVRAWYDLLAPVNMDFCEIAEVTLADGRVVEGGLYVDYHETAAPWIAGQLAREYHRRARRDEDYRVLDVAFLEADFSVAYLDELHMQTVIWQKGNRVIRASFHPYSDTVELPIEVWAAVLAESIRP